MARSSNKPRLTREDALAYRERWRLVHEVEVAELCRMSLNEKMRQLRALMTMGRAFGWLDRLEMPAESRCENWLRLRRALRD